jgi:hypothetical protein
MKSYSDRYKYFVFGIKDKKDIKKERNYKWKN